MATFFGVLLAILIYGGFGWGFYQLGGWGAVALYTAFVLLTVLADVVVP